MRWLHPVKICRALLYLTILASSGTSAVMSNAAELPVVAPERVGMSAAKLAKVDEAMEKLVAEKKLAGAVVMIARQGQVVHWQSYGHQDREANVAMQKDSIFRVYSMTKAITSAAALILLDEGKLNLDDPVSKFLPELKGMKVSNGSGNVAPKREMTVRDLMRHTAGLSYGFNGDSPVDKAYLAANLLDRDRTLDSMSKALGSLPLLYEPGEAWVYSISVDLLGRVVEVVSGSKLDKFLDDRILGPLDMRDTGFSVAPHSTERFTANYTSDGKGMLTLRDAPGTSRYLKPPAMLSGGGGLVSTARDYMRFLVMISSGGQLDGKRIISADSVKLMTTDQLPEGIGWIRFGDDVRRGVGFGLGFAVRVETALWDRHGRIGEYGWGGAASTHYWVSPHDELAVVTMEQVMPYSFLTEFKIKGLVYDAIQSNAAPQPKSAQPKSAQPKSAQPKSAQPSAVLPANVEQRLDTVYASYGDRAMYLDLFLPQQGPAVKPAVVVVHGGGWLRGDKAKFRPLAMALAARGYVTAAIEYRLGGEAQFPAAIHDCNAAVRWLRAHAKEYGIDPRRIAAVGGSAGGHLVGLMAAGPAVASLQGTGGNADRSSQLQAAVVMAGPLELATGPVADRSRNEPALSNSNKWLGKTIDEAPDLYRLASATTHLSSRTPPILFMTGEHDNPARNIATRRRLRELGIPSEIKVYKQGKHGCWNRLPWFTPMVDDIDAFLTEALQKDVSPETIPLSTTGWGTIRYNSAGLELQIDRIPPDHSVEIPRLNNPIGKIYIQGDAKQTALPIKPGLTTWKLTLPPGLPAGGKTVIVVETIGTPYLPVIPRIVGASSNGDVTLSAHDAITQGELLRYEPQPHKNTVGYWANANDTCQWHFYTDEAGQFDLHILQGCGKGQGGSTVEIRVGDRAVEFVVEDTGHFQNFKDRKVGTLTLSEPGLHTLTMRPISKAKNAVMDVRKVRLVRRAAAE